MSLDGRPKGFSLPANTTPSNWPEKSSSSPCWLRSTPETAWLVLPRKWSSAETVPRKTGAGIPGANSSSSIARITGPFCRPFSFFIAPPSGRRLQKGASARPVKVSGFSPSGISLGLGVAKLSTLAGVPHHEKRSQTPLRGSRAMLAGHAFQRVSGRPGWRVFRDGHNQVQPRQKTGVTRTRRPIR